MTSPEPVPTDPTELEQPPGSLTHLIELLLVGAATEKVLSALIGLPGVSPDAARALLRSLPARPPRRPADAVAPDSIRATNRLNTVRRAQYLARAARRISSAPNVAEGVRTELGHFQAHRRASENRRMAAAAVAQAEERFGPELGWYAKMDSRTSAECRAANGTNFRAGVPPRIGYPGAVHPHCRCRPGKPHQHGAGTGSVRAGQEVAAVNRTLPAVELTNGHPPFQWRHGWIPLTPQAARIKAKKKTGKATDRPILSVKQVPSASWKKRVMSPPQVRDLVTSDRPFKQTRMPGQTTGTVFLREYEDGSKVVVRKESLGKLQDEKDYHSAAKLFGAPVPDLYYDDKTFTSYAGFVKGDPAGKVAKANPWPSPEARDSWDHKYANSPGGRKLGMLDVAFGMSDRHLGNWMIVDGQPVGIDNVVHRPYRKGQKYSPQRKTHGIFAVNIVKTGVTQGEYDSLVSSLSSMPDGWGKKNALARTEAFLKPLVKGEVSAVNKYDDSRLIELAKQAGSLRKVAAHLGISRASLTNYLLRRPQLDLAVRAVLTSSARPVELAVPRNLQTAARKKAAGSGKALPDGSFPIRNVDELRKAIQAFGRAGNKKAAKAFIIKRARELKATHLIPEAWNAIGLATETKSSAYPKLERVPGKQNWVDKAGGLPAYIERIAKHLHYEKGMDISRAIAVAVNTVKRWAAGGTVTENGTTKHITAKTQAQAAAAVAEWEAKKASSHSHANRGGRALELATYSEAQLNSYYKPTSSSKSSTQKKSGGGTAQPASSSGKKKIVRTPAGATRYHTPIGTEIGKARNAEAAKAQQNKAATDKYKAVVTAKDRDAQVKALNNDELGQLSQVAFSFKSADPQVVALRNSVIAQMRARGMDPSKYGYLGGKITSKPVPTRK